MTTATPDAVELVRVVADWLRKDVLQILGERRFEGLVAANVLDIVARELTFGPDAADRKQDRLRELLNSDAMPDEMEAALSTAIRTGSPALDPEALAAFLWVTTLDRLAIDQPKYAAFRRETEQDGPKGEE
jgi:hypothetical protein